MSSQICLKWNSFHDNIVSSFESLWLEEGLVDVTLTSDGQCLTAHKVILSASSPFFKKVFKSNPCQHPVIILQDVHFSELEALLIFIYKGEVNIEQKNLPALLKAAETLQIRGLSGSNVFSKQSNFKKLSEVGERLLDNDNQQNENQLKKKRRLAKNSQIFNKALAPQLLTETMSDTTEITTSRTTISMAINNKTCIEPTLSDILPTTFYDNLDIKVEPHEIEHDINIENLEREDENNCAQLDTGQEVKCQESRSPAEEIFTLSGLEMSDSTRLSQDKSILYSYQQLPYANMLPSPETISTWASSRPIDQLACDLMKILFTPEERIKCNVNGKMGKKQFDSCRIHLLREVLLHFSVFTSNSLEWEETWKNCVTKIDTSNRGLKRYLYQRRTT